MAAAKALFDSLHFLTSAVKAAKQSLRRVAGPGEPIYKLPDYRMPGVIHDALAPFDLQGDNWFQDEDLPIAIFWGFNPWKRPYMQAFFPGHKLAFVRGTRTYLGLAKFLTRFPQHREVIFVGWGTKLPAYARRFAQRHSISMRFVEDGFLRSFHPGALHTRPYSLAIDASAPYYDTSSTTDLRRILESAPTTQDDVAANKAEAGIALMRAAFLTKYYSLRIESEVWTPPPLGGQALVLVVGQVEDDASIRLGYKRHAHEPRFSNYLLVKQAVESHPGACVLYRPHPDTFHNGRKSRREAEIARLCTMIAPTVPLHAVFPYVKHVYVGTSLVGLEAALWGIPVTTLGLPFYAATEKIRSLQSSRVTPMPRLGISALFQAVYLDYPKYVHPDSDELADFFDIASYFVVEKFKHLVLDGVPAHELDVPALERIADYLSPPLKLFLHLLRVGRLGVDSPQEIVGLAGSPLRYQDVPQFSELLIKACRFDALALYLSKTVHQFSAEIEILKNRKALMARVLDIIVDNEKALRGRVGFLLPDVVDWIAPQKFPGYIIPDDLLLGYARALSNNLQYDLLERVVFNIEHAAADSMAYGVPLLRALTALLTAKPARSERNAGKRAELSERAARLYQNSLLLEGKTDPLFARALADLALDAPHACKAVCEEMLERLDAEAAGESRPLLEQYKRNSGQVYMLVSYLTRQSMHDTVDRLMAALECDEQKDDRAVLQRLRILVERHEFAKFHALHAGLSEELKARLDVNEMHVRALMEQGDFLSAHRIVRAALNQTNITRRKRALLYEQQEKIAFSLEASRILDAVPQPHLPKGVVVLGTFTDYKALAMLVPALMEVRRKGYAVVSLINGVLRQTPTGLPFIDQLIGLLPASTASRKSSHKNDWYVHWNEREVSCNGVNYYQGFYESLSNFFRRYVVDLNDQAVRRNFFYRLVRADDSLEACNRIYRDVVRRGMPCIILSGDGHVVPHSIFRDFCRAQNHPLLSYVNVNIGYENYFTNLGGRYSSTMTVTDHTLFPNHRAPFLARPDRFERWYAAEKDNEVYRKRADELIQTNRVHAHGDGASRALIEYLQGQRSTGRRVVCCLGKIPIDLGVPFDGGPAHEDLKDWLNHTIDVVRGQEDILLLIKPHPHEIQPSIALDLLDGFADLIEGPIPSNVRLLGHREINNHQLAPCLDLTLMWNGSSAAELAALGVPVMMASHFGRHDYPIDLLYPTDRDDYEAFIRGGLYKRPDDETRRRAAYLIAYLETSDVTIRNDYAWRPVTNDSVGVPSWRPERVDSLLRNGDPEMARAAARILERFEGACD